MYKANGRFILPSCKSIHNKKMILIRTFSSHFVSQLAHSLLFWLTNNQRNALVLLLIE
jgi:hypothetical protein